MISVGWDQDYKFQVSDANSLSATVHMYQYIKSQTGFRKIRKMKNFDFMYLIHVACTIVVDHALIFQKYLLQWSILHCESWSISCNNLCQTYDLLTMQIEYI